MDSGNLQMIHHIGIITRNYSHNALLELIAGANLEPIKCLGSKYIEEWQCTCYLYSVGGETRLELIIPHDGKLLEWLNEHPENSLHHMAVRVEDIRISAGLLREVGVELLTTEPVEGVCNTLVNFVHPSYCGVMLELVQEL